MNDIHRDRLDIADLFNRYAAALDLRQWDKLAALFAPEATAQLPADSEVIAGRDAIVAFISNAIESVGPTHHVLTNHVAEVTGNSAVASCYLRAYHAGRGKHADKFEESLGRFEAALTCSGGSWRFTSLSELIVIMLGTADVFGPQDDRF